MKKLNHENILKLISSFEDEHNHYLVIEICNKLVTNLFIVEFEWTSKAKNKDDRVISKVLY